MIFENVVDDDGEPIEFDTNSYWCKVYVELQTLLPDFNEFLFCEFNHDDMDLPATRFYPHDKKVLIWLSGEKKLHEAHKLKEDFCHVFANYHWDDENVTSIPLGYNYFYDGNSQIPVNERIYNLSFMGALNRNRISMVSALTGIHRYLIALGLFVNYEKTLRFLNHFMDWTRKDGKFFFSWEFNSGVEGKQFCNTLRQTKIALAPKGWVNTETYRMYEAMQYGCVVVSDKLPKRKYYENLPVIQVEDWKKGFKVVKELLKDEDLLKSLSDKHKQFYEGYLSPKATAKIISEKLILK